MARIVAKLELEDGSVINYNATEGQKLEIKLEDNVYVYYWRGYGQQWRPLISKLVHDTNWEQYYNKFHVTKNSAYGNKMLKLIALFSDELKYYIPHSKRMYLLILLYVGN